MVMRDHLPAGLARLAARRILRGVHVDDFDATQLGHVLRRQRLLSPLRQTGRDETTLRLDRACVHDSRSCSLSAVVTFYLESIRQAWEFVLESGAGIGLVLILRWYWWRINAWSEIAAMVGAAIGYAALKIFTALAFPVHAARRRRVDDCLLVRRHDADRTGV